MREGAELEWTKRILENALTDADLYRRIRGTGQREAELAVASFSEVKDSAALGDRQARDKIVGYFSEVIENQAGGNLARVLAGLVDFENIENNEDDVIFEMLTDGESFANVLAKYAEEDIFDSEMLRKAVKTENSEGRIQKKYLKREEKLRFVAERMYAYVYGQDCIDSLQYQDINEIGMLSANYIYVIFRGRKVRLPFLRMADTSVLINIQKKTTQNSALNFDRQNPILVTAKNNSSRISVAAFDVTPFDSDVYYNERIFNLNVITLEEMRDRFGTIDGDIYRFLCMNQRGRGSFLVTGSDMGVGKSTFLLAMIEKYPDYWGIGVLDAQNELQTGLKYPGKNVITLVENSKKTLSQCFAYLLKTSRDIIVVGEITLPEEVSEMINAAMRLNAGVCGTMHSLSPAETIPNLRNLMLRTDMYNSKDAAEDDAAGAIDLVIHLRRLAKGRIVAETIHEICLPDEEFLSDQLIETEKWQENEENEEFLRKTLLKLKIMSERSRLSGKRYEMRKLFAYNASSDCWDSFMSPSEKYFRKMERYVGAEEIGDIRKMFSERRKKANEN